MQGGVQPARGFPEGSLSPGTTCPARVDVSPVERSTHRIKKLPVSAIARLLPSIIATLSGAENLAYEPAPSA